MERASAAASNNASGGSLSAHFTCSPATKTTAIESAQAVLLRPQTLSSCAIRMERTSAEVTADSRCTASRSPLAIGSSIMPSRRTFLHISASSVGVMALSPLLAKTRRFPVERSDAEWRRRLSPATYAVLRRHATERPGSSPLDREKRRGSFGCAGCDQPLFSSATKFDSGTGWPSFSASISKVVGTKRDHSTGFVRVGVHCARCGGHLGHLFHDGPRPTGKRYCTNGAAIRFVSAT